MLLIVNLTRLINFLSIYISVTFNGSEAQQQIHTSGRLTLDGWSGNTKLWLWICKLSFSDDISELKHISDKQIIKLMNAVEWNK